MQYSSIVLLLVLAQRAIADHEMRIWNNCSFTIWPGLLNGANQVLPESGGFQLDPYNTNIFQVPDAWAGRIWARTGCYASGHCKTSDCGNQIECQGAVGYPPVSMAEFILDGPGALDFYDVSVMDGYNLPVSIFLIDGTYRRVTDFRGDCDTAGCNADLNAHCPDELAIKNSEGITIACQSPCLAFNTDEYCCRGTYNQPETCKPTDWSTNYPAIFKQSCPDAFSYAYDDVSNIFTCHGNPKTGYVIKFCP